MWKVRKGEGEGGRREEGAIGRKKAGGRLSVYIIMTLVHIHICTYNCTCIMYIRKRVEGVERGDDEMVGGRVGRKEGEVWRTNLEWDISSFVLYIAMWRQKCIYMWVCNMYFVCIYTCMYRGFVMGVVNRLFPDNAAMVSGKKVVRFYTISEMQAVRNLYFQYVSCQ